MSIHTFTYYEALKQHLYHQQSFVT